MTTPPLPLSQMETLKQFITLINQLVSRHRDAVLQCLVQIFPTLFSSIFTTLRLPVEDGDQNSRAEIAEV